MKTTDIYFEEIFFPVKNLWEKQYFLVYGNKSETFIKALGEDFDRIEHIVGSKKNEFNEWHDMMVLVTYQILTEVGLDLLSRKINTLYVDDIPIERFEIKYKQNLQYEGNEKFLSKYKGFKSNS